MTLPRRHMSARARAALFGLSALALAGATACEDAPTPAPDPLRIAVMLDVAGPDTPEWTEDRLDTRTRSFDWALENIEAAGGVDGRPLVVDYFMPMVDDVLDVADGLAHDNDYVAVIAPPGSTWLAQMADTYVEVGKPLLSTSSTADELLRAYGGVGEIWRLRQSDIPQTELLVHFAREQGAQRISLVTGLELSSVTFFTWFGFFATELGFDSDAIEIATFEPEGDCVEVVEAALDSDMMFVAADEPEQIRCVVDSLPPAPDRPRIVLADTGLDARMLLELGAQAEGIEGLRITGEEDFELAANEREPGLDVAPYAASEYDALVLLAYGLEGSEGIGGKPLIDALERAVDGEGPSLGGWDATGIAANLEALRAGATPSLHGATGPLRFEPELYMDLAVSSFVHFVVDEGKLVDGQRYTTDDPSFLTSDGVMSAPPFVPDAGDSEWTPTTTKTDAWAVIAALSSGWNNYRHQADALRQYWLLREGGIDDEHIVLILADDLADDPQNERPGQVRNELEGPDLRAGAQIDYDLSLDPEQLADIIAGRASRATPTVIEPSASSDIYLYFVGHGGPEGILVGAQTLAEGMAGGDRMFSPTLLRERLCELHDAQRYRRVLVAIESCYGGVFGEATAGGIELGCGDAPLDGVVMLTAANSVELSYALTYDPEVPGWIDDAFSQHFASGVELGWHRNLADVYVDIYLSTVGSHPAVFNYGGKLSEIELGEFFLP